MRRLTAADIYQGGASTDPFNQRRHCSVGWVTDFLGESLEINRFRELCLEIGRLAGASAITHWSDTSDPGVVAGVLNDIFEANGLLDPEPTEELCPASTSKRSCTATTAMASVG